MKDKNNIKIIKNYINSNISNNKIIVILIIKIIMIVKKILKLYE